jgi:hypothetical protein
VIGANASRLGAAGWWRGAIRRPDEAAALVNALHGVAHRLRDDARRPDDRF